MSDHQLSDIKKSSNIVSARHRRMKRKRRSSRVMSALEPLYSSPSQPKVTAEPPLSGGEEMKEEPVDLPPITSHSAPSTASPDFDIAFSDAAADSSYSYVFHKKKKVLLLHALGHCACLFFSVLECVFDVNVYVNGAVLVCVLLNFGGEGGGQRGHLSISFKICYVFCLYVILFQW